MKRTKPFDTERDGIGWSLAASALERAADFVKDQYRKAAVGKRANLTEAQAEKWLFTHLPRLRRELANADSPCWGLLGELVAITEQIPTAKANARAAFGSAAQSERASKPRAAALTKQVNARIATLLSEGRKATKAIRKAIEAELGLEAGKKVTASRVSRIRKNVFLR